ncbi:hypothetical protein DENIS_3115 [Desulfonema ishimotonii]|uniref:Lipoprotein n=1 Tax=Desulfonema ishimotonii TaxID=45657 RepID=A0A401FYT1_9BACT|nr:hypothetical protein [Desulfonema ishimotonii]GBC62152.1 hypothetical protein DENIS_3115 [Desulfonema ishimotonii]
MRGLNLTAILLSLISFASCTPFVPFTALHMQMVGGTPPDRLQNLQFYISDEIRLRREIGYQERYVEDATHTIRVEDRRQILEIRIPRHTPGVLSRVAGDTLYVRFEGPPGDPGREIPFTKRPRNVYLTDEPEDFIYQLRPERLPFYLMYGGNLSEVCFSTEKTEVSRENVDMYAGKGDHVKRHYYMKTLYPVLMVRPVRQTSDVERAHRTLPGQRLTVPEEATPVAPSSGPATF